MLIAILVCGLYVPMASLIVGCINCVARPIYTYKYAKSGPGGRLIPFIAGTLSVFGLIGYTACYGLWVS